MDSLPPTLVLAAAAIGLAVMLGVPLGCWCALRPNSLADRIVGFASITMLALPTSVISIYALLLFAVTLHWFPAIGTGRPDDIGDQLHHLILPALTVGIGWTGYLARFVRASMLEALQEGHVRTYRAFGVRDNRIALRFVLPIAIVPVLSVLGVGIGGLLSNTIITEIVFVRPGLGRLIYDAVITRNVPVILGTVVVAATLYLLFNLLADLLIASLDPRVRNAL
jgi:peptide/nickel transport system permease protein